MRKLLLRCGFSPGDIVMLTAAVRDLHRGYPGRFATDVRTPFPDLWEYNPYITPLRDDDPDVKQIDCYYPLIDHSNDLPYHCLHGFRTFLNERLRLSIKPTAFKGDIHLSAQEKAWYSQVQELTGEDTPFWIVAAGGKYDVTIKWWDSARYQEVIDHFRGKIQFVQVGADGHHHPKLEGAIDLRGQTSLRQLIRLVHHAQGVLCSVTALMHLAAAVATRRGRPAVRPCVVVAGGREPAHWEAYPGHQFIHTIGALPCCAHGGCWKDRTVQLRDGDHRDRSANLCVDVIQGFPRCMDMITAAQVIRRIEMYFDGGTCRYLTARQHAAAERGVLATAQNSYDPQPLSLQSAGMACERFITTIPPCPDRYSGRGVVICAGRARYFTNAWVCIHMLRQLGCHLPIQVWHLGAKEMDEHQKALLAPLGVECIDARRKRGNLPARIAGGWSLKSYAILESSFREVLLLDADNVPVVNPEFLFDTPEFQAVGAIFWPDRTPCGHGNAKTIWRSCGLRPPKEPEFESGQIVLDKHKCWRALRLTLWFNENWEFYYQHLHGDKETFHVAFQKLRQDYSLVPKPVHALEGALCQHDFQGRRIFQHRSGDKWDLLGHNKRVKDFRFENECRGYVERLRSVWDGGIGAAIKNGKNGAAVPGRSGWKPRTLKFEATLISCAGQTESQNHTLVNLARTDWGEAPSEVVMKEGRPDTYLERQAECAHRALKESLSHGAEYLLLLRGALDFNQRIRHNLCRWKPLCSEEAVLASLHNPGVCEMACDLESNARLVEPKFVSGTQAFLIPGSIIPYLLRRWPKVAEPLDLTIARLAWRLRRLIYYHAPSLVQLIGVSDRQGRQVRPAIDFDPDFIA